VRAQDPPETIGLFRPNSPPDTNTFFLRNANSLAPPANTIAGYGVVGDEPVVGDWDGDGIMTIGVFRPDVPAGTNTFFLRNTNNLGIGDIVIEAIGATGDLPIVGDWDGNGTTTVGLLRPDSPSGSNTLFLWNSHANPPGPPDVTIVGIGAVGDLPIAGNWTDSDPSSIGLFRSGSPAGSNTVFIWNSLPTTPPFVPDVTIAGIGAAGDQPVVGDWDGNPTVTIGLFRSGEPPGTNTFYLWNSNALVPPYVPDLIIAGFGAVGDLPVAGRFGNNPPVVNPETFEVAEDSANGTIVGTVTFTDPDNPGQTHTFSITAGNTDNAFTIGATSGEITVANSVALTTPSFSLTVRVTDDGTPVFFGEATITINITEKQNQTISFTSSAPASAMVGGPTYNVTATATSGLPVSFTIDGSAASVCAIAGSTVSFIGVGTCVINANQAGDTDFNPAPQVQQSFAVGRGMQAQTISFTSVVPTNATVGGPAYLVSATATSGLPVAFTIDPSATSVCAIAASTVSFIGSGTCLINANQAGDDTFDPAPQVQQMFAVKSSQTISFTSTPPATPTVGGPTYNVTATATSGLPVTFTIDGSAASVCSIAGSTVSFGPNAGTCVINANQAGDATFGPAPQVQQSFSVQKAQTITFTSVAPNPALFQGPTYTVTATATSALAVTFAIDASASTVCSLAGSTVSFIGTGICVINANQGGNAEFYPAPQAQQSFGVVPNAVGDTYNALGNVLVDSNSSNAPNTPFSVTANDVFPAGTTISAFMATSTQGGTVTMTTSGANLGRFTYNPPVGFTGTDTFTYTLSSNGQTRQATVTFTVTGKVWFINNNAGACPAAPCNGRLTNPFVDTANFQAVNAGAAPTPQNNDAVFVYSSPNPYNGATTLRNGQRLVGQGATGTLATLGNVTAQNGQILPSTGGTVPVLGSPLTVGSGNFIHGLTLSGGTALTGTNFGTLTVNDNVAITTTGQAINLATGTFNATLTGVTSTGGANNVNLNTVAGTVNLGSGALSGATGDAFLVNTGTANISYAGTIASGNARSVNISNKTGGSTVTLSGAIADTDTGISLTNNGASGGATITFQGGLSANTGANAALTATGGGTVNVCALNPCGTGAAVVNTLTTTTGTALNVANTTIGASGLTFRSISSNGGTSGIVLNTTGAGGLTVTGTETTAGSGGTIQNTTTRGASFIGASNITLQNMNFTNAATNDFPPAPTGLSLGNNTADNAAIHLQTVTNVTLDRVNINGSAEHGINGHNVTNFVLQNSVISNAGNGPDEDGIHLFNMLGTSAITNTTITSSGDDNINIQNNTNLALPAGMSAVLDLSITGGSANTGVLGSGYLMGIRGTSNATVTIDGVTANNNFSGGIVIDTFDTATSVIEITNSTSTNNNDAISLSSNNGNTRFDIHNNLSFAGTDFGRINILKAAFSTTGTLEGRIRNNPIVVGDGQAADGIVIFQAGDGTLTVSITDNDIDYRGTQRAINIQGGQDGSGQLNATVTGNTIDMQIDGTNNPTTGILAQVAVASPSGDNTNMCADLGGAGALQNTFTHSLGNNIAAGDIRVRQRFVTTVTLPGYAGANSDNAAVVAYLAGRNTLVNSPTATATNEVGVTAGAGGFVGGVACPQPVFP